MPKLLTIPLQWIRQSLFMLLLLTISITEAQNLQGPTQVSPNSTHDYTFSNGLLANPTWTVVGGTALSTTMVKGTAQYTATVQWGAAGAGSVTFNSFGTPLETLNVTITGSGTGATLLSDRNYVYTLVPRE
ncbi:hypothetical protein FJ651_15575, partial [Paucihalobacter ruber]